MAYTEAEIKTQIGNAMYLLEMTRQFGSANTPNVIARYDALVEAQEGSTAAQVSAAAQAFRNHVSNALLPAMGRAMVTPLLLEMAIVKGYADRSPEAILRRLLYDWAQPTAVTIQDRDFTFGGVTAGGSNVGTGTVRRLTVDPYDYPIQTTHPELRQLICKRDEGQGVYAGQEEFEFEGIDVEPDRLKIIGSGLKRVPIRAADANDAAALLQNPSFSGSEIGSTFSGWTFSGITAAHDTTNYYRTYRGEGTAGSLKVDANGYFYQALTTRRFAFREDWPYWLQLAWNRAVGSAPASTTITIKLGSRTSLATVTLSGSETGWQILGAPLDKYLYYQNWRTTSAQLRVTVGSLGSGYLLFDDIVFAPMQRIDGLWYLPVGGATPFAGGGRDAGDQFTFDDSVVTGATLAYWFWQLYGVAGQLPNAASPTWADPIAWA